MVFNFDFAMATVCSCLLTFPERFLEANPNTIEKTPKTPPTTPKGTPTIAPKPVREVPNPLADRRTETNPPETLIFVHIPLALLYFFLTSS